MLLGHIFVVLVFSALQLQSVHGNTNDVDDLIVYANELLGKLTNKSSSLNWKVEDVEKDVSTLKCGFDSLKEDVAVLESASSELLHLSSEIGPCLEEHSQQTEKQFPKIKMSVEDKILAADKLEEFTHPCGGSGWKLAIYEDFRNPNTPCPNGWEQTGYDEKPYTCGIDVTGGSICAEALFPLRDGILEYNKVCGRVKAYQFGTPDAFAASNPMALSGIVITHGPSLTIIWALVAGTTNDDSDSAMGRCPCDGADPAPSLYGDNYFCESLIDNPDPGTTFDNVFFSKDILWDEIGCTSSGDCCSRFTGPYFIRQLDSPTTDDINIFICNDEGRDFENFAVELVEIYVK